jgi:hypothetical protein
MAWLFVPGLADLKSDSSSPLAMPTGVRCTLRGKPLQPQSWRRVWGKVAWTRHLSGMTLSPSTLSRGVESFLSSLRASLANPGATPASGRDGPMTGGSGRLYLGSLAWFDPASSSWRMCQGSLLGEDLNTSSVTLPKWGSMRSGAVSRRRPWAPPTAESGCSSWATPGAENGAEIAAFRPSRLETGRTTEYLGRQVAMWRSPTTTDTGTPPETLTDKNGDPPKLGQRMYRRGKNGELINQTQSLELQVKVMETWATPVTRDHKGGADWENRQRGGLPRRLSDMSLADQAESSSPPAPATPAGPTFSASTPGSRRRLSPAFVCWLMGLPWWWTNPGWISSGPAEMESYLCRLRSRLEFLLGAWDWPHAPG